MKWLDIEDIVEELECTRPDEDLMSISFTDLRKWVLSISTFDDEPDGCNERILEAIQAKWIELRQDNE